MPKRKQQTPAADCQSIYEFQQRFPNEAAAVAFFEERRWHGQPVCPHCQAPTVSRVKSGQPMPWRCRACRKHFSVRTGTVLTESKLPLHKWLLAVHFYHTARKGLSSIQLAKELGVTQKTAWFLGHRIRAAMAQHGGLLAGEIEADETFLGGREANKHARKKLHAGRGAVGKQPVFGLRERTGKVRAFPINKVDKDTLHAAIKAHVEPGATVYTDTHPSYRGLDGYDHQSVAHSLGEYVRGRVTTNGLESFWALLKRGYVGTHHWWSLPHLYRYVDEFAYRLNAGPDNNPPTMGRTLDGMVGKRLTYRQLIAAGQPAVLPRSGVSPQLLGGQSALPFAYRTTDGYAETCLF